MFSTCASMMWRSQYAPERIGPACLRRPCILPLTVIPTEPSLESSSCWSCLMSSPGRFLGSLLILTTAVITARAQITSNAVCNSTFLWMFNSLNQSPCVVAGYLMATCGNGNYTVGALPNGDRYDQPGNGKNLPLTTCSCSWAVYNLFSACTICQAGEPMSWDTYDQDCTGFLSDTTFFPANETFPSTTSIPFWAGINPTTWQDHVFNTTVAESDYNEGKPDYNSTSFAATTSTSSATPTATSSAPTATAPPSKSNSSAGPIAGGVVGGLAVLAAGACAFFFPSQAQERGARKRGCFTRDGSLEW